MTSRLLFALLLLASLAFAPAPLPRRDREKAQDDLVRIQGVWDRISHNGQPGPRSVVEVKGDVWIAVVHGHSWRFKFDQTARPRRVELVSIESPNSYYIGVYKFEGDTFTYSLRVNAKEEQRPLDFDLHQPHVSVFVRRKP